MRLCWLPVYLAALSPFPSGAGDWLRGAGDMGPCKKLLLNGQPPDGLETSQRPIVPFCKCFRRQCVYVAALQGRKPSPLYWAYRSQDQWGSISVQDSSDGISIWHIPSSGEMLAPMGSTWKSGTSRPVTHVVSGEFSRQNMGLDEHLGGPGLVWIAYHHTTATKQTFQGALVKETAGARRWVHITLVQLQERLTATCPTASPVKIFPSYQERQQRTKPDGLKEARLGVKTPLMERVLSGQQKARNNLDVSVKMVFSVPESLDKGLVRQQDYFQVQSFYPENSPKWAPALEVVMMGEIIETKEIPVAENSKGAQASPIGSSVSHTILNRVYGFKADSTEDDNDFKLSKKFIGAKRHILSQPQHEMLPPVHKQGEDHGNPEYPHTTPQPSHTVVEPAMLPTEMLESPGAATLENDYTEVTNDPGPLGEEPSTPCSQDAETSEETGTVLPQDTEASLPPESPETECTEQPDVVTRSTPSSSTELKDLKESSSTTIAVEPTNAVDILETECTEQIDSLQTEGPPLQTTVHTTTSTAEPTTAAENLETECTDETQMPPKSVDDFSLTTAGPDIKTTVENTVEPPDGSAESNTAASIETNQITPTEHVSKLADAFTTTVGIQETANPIETSGLTTEAELIPTYPPEVQETGTQHQTESPLLLSVTAHRPESMFTNAITIPTTDTVPPALTESQYKHITAGLETEITEDTDSPPERVNEATSAYQTSGSTEDDPTDRPPVTTGYSETEYTGETESPPTEKNHDPSPTTQSLETERVEEAEESHDTESTTVTSSQVKDSDNGWVLPGCTGLIHRTEAGARRCAERWRFEAGMGAKQTRAPAEATSPILDGGEPGQGQSHSSGPTGMSAPGPESLTVSEGDEGRADLPAGKDTQKTDHKSSAAGDNDHFYYFNGKLKKTSNYFDPKESGALNSYNRKER